MRICLVASAIFVGAVSVLSLALPSATQPRTRQRIMALSRAPAIGAIRATENDAALASDQDPASSRRSFMSSLMRGTLLAAIAASSPVYALPMVTAEEFDIILRDSSRSIEQVEFSGPRSETIIVRLVDGTAFGIQGVVESSTDPRSPLKIAAACKAYQVPARFVDLENVLAASPRKKKLYTNTRVLEAAAREEEKKLRLQQDEEIRQAELAQMRARD